MTPVKDLEGVPFNLAVIHSGIMVYQNVTKVNTFVWIKIRKLSFKRKRFLIKLHQEVSAQLKLAAIKEALKFQFQFK